MGIPIEEDPDYHPEPIDHLDPSTTGMKELEKYIFQFDREVQEINKIRETGTAKDYTKAKMNRRSELKNKMAEFEIEKENRLANMGESRRSEDPEGEKDPKGPLKGQGQLKSPWDRQKPKKGTYPTVGPKGPGDLNLEGDWEGPIELFEFEDIEEGWINCTTGYYWHSVLGGGICQYADEWYRNWEFDYKPPENEVVPEEPGEASQEVPEVPQDPPDDKVTTKQTKDIEEEKSTASRHTSAQQSKPAQPKPPGSSLLTKDPLAPLSLEESD